MNTRLRMRALTKAQKGQPWYQTKVWQERKLGIKRRVKRKQDAAHARAVERNKPKEVESKGIIGRMFA